MNRSYYIYALRHNVTGKMYIGCSMNSSRIKSHLYKLKKGSHTNKELQRDCNEYGFKFTAYILEIIPCGAGNKADSHEREAFWIHYYGTDIEGRGYNSPEIYKRIDISTFPKVKDTEEMRLIVDQ